MDVSLIYYETLKLINLGTRRIVHQGGQSSGKTVNILAALAHVAAERPLVITITSMSFPHLKSGAMRDFERYVMPTFADCIKQFRKTDHVVLFESGSIIEFKSYETEYDARGAKRDILYVNEANTFDYMTWFQLDSRSTQSIIDYNPTIRFWAHEKVINNGAELRISYHVHNPFLSPQKHKEIENICTFNAVGSEMVMGGLIPPKECVVSGDYELWKVYARGLTGNVIGLIFPDWVMIEDHEFDNFFFAVDFGYENDPTAIVKIEKKFASIYIEELAYQPGSMTAREIRTLLRAYGMDEEETVLYCEHDPDMIRQLKQLEVPATAARKGAGSINAGISKLKEYKVYYIGKNIKTETQMYIWETNEEGKPTNKPVDKHNHLIDAIRYGVYSHFYRSQNEEE